MQLPLLTKSRTLWWVHPCWIVAAPLVLISIVAYLLPESAYQANWRTQKSFGASDLLLCLAVVVAFSAGCLLSSWMDSGFTIPRRIPPAQQDARGSHWRLKILFDLGFLATLTGYAIWFGSILKQGGIGMITAMLTGEAGASDLLKESSKDSIITGITTFTQFGMATTLLGTYLGFTKSWRMVRWRLALLLGLTILRAIFLSERLSIIEVVLPSALLLIRLADFWRARPALRRALILTPFFGIAALYTLFTFTEYFRSWSSFYAEHGDQSLLTFGLLRLLGYYVTALNNGAIEWHEHGALYFPYSTLDWLWKFPLVGSAFRLMLGGTNKPSDTRGDLLTDSGNPEFNNPSGIFVVFTDLGAPGALLYFFLLGCVAGLLFAAYRRSSVVGLFLYPFLFTGLTELVRISYVDTGRAFPTWVLLLAAILVSWPARHRSSPPHPS